MTHKAKRIFMMADFKDDKTWSMCLDEWRILKGWIRLGHDVHRLSYRNLLMQTSPFPGKRMAMKLAKKKANELVVDQLKYYYPDMVFFSALKNLDGGLIDAMRHAAPNAVFMGKDGDPFPDQKPQRIGIGKKMDIMTMPSAGRFLETYKNAGVPVCAFIPFTCDPDIQHGYAEDKKWMTDMVWTGTAEHSKHDREDDRYNIVSKLADMPNAAVYGACGRPKTNGLDSFYVLGGAKIGVSINIANDVYLYHSDRFINIPACGTLCLAKKAPGYERMFTDKVQVRYFENGDEFFELAAWYLRHDEEREKMAAAGMQQAHKEFNCTRVAQCMLDVMEKGTCDAPWGVVL
jgi:hypothetical protein